MTTLKHPSGFKAEIVQDPDPTDPREDDNAFTIACCHKRYNLGDDDARHNDPNQLYRNLLSADDWSALMDQHELQWQALNAKNATAPDHFKRSSAQALREEHRNEIMTKIRERYPIFEPLYMYDHSGLTISLKPFSCPWDSGQIGWVYIGKEKLAEEWGSGPDAMDKARACLKAEVETYDQYLTGDVWGVRIKNADGEEMDSCWGFFGDHARTEAQQMLDAAVKNHEKETADNTMREHFAEGASD